MSGAARPSTNASTPAGHATVRAQRTLIPRPCGRLDFAGALPSTVYNRNASAGRRFGRTNVCGMLPARARVRRTELEKWCAFRYLR